MNWKNDPRIAQHWKLNPNTEKITCNLCPRHCTLKKEQDGFCKVRGNRDNQLFTFNYGRSVTATEETIETEAVYHYSPGAKILSMGNIGCMMACSFCQNWQTSQVKHLDGKNVSFYTPEDVVQLALSNNIDIISWTYNDPVVWHEFVVDTSRLAKKHGIKTLYKSALYIEIEPVKELIQVIDIFSISLKSMSKEIYRKVTKGRLQPVLDAIKVIAQSDRHLEISQLVVTGMNDDGVDARKTAKWIFDNLGSNIPLHFVGYHPAFRYTAPRTPLEVLVQSRKIALEEGIKYCYLGNVYDGNVSNTNCENCNNELVQRFGLTINVVGLDEKSCCKKCGKKSPIIEPLSSKRENFYLNQTKFIPKQSFDINWDKEINSLHVVAGEKYNSNLRVKVERLPLKKVELLQMNKGLERIILSKGSDEETGIKISFDSDIKMHLLPVLDRAHFPVIEEHKNKKYLN